MEPSDVVREYQGGRRDFSGADLRGASLAGEHLEGIDLSNANLSNANLRGTNLTGARLIGAQLLGADLRGADLAHADLSGADLSGVTAWGAKVSGTRLRDALIRNARGWWRPRVQRHIRLSSNLDVLRENARQATQHAGALFITQLTIGFYGALTAVAVADMEFLGSVASIKLPFVDVSVRTSVFFVVLPLLTLAIQIYYLFYYSLAKRLWRVVDEQGAESQSPLELELIRYPWIGLLVGRPGFAARVASFPFLLLSWGTTPCLLWIFWTKTAPFRSTVALWKRDGAPSSVVFALAAALVLVLLVAWALYEDALERGVLEIRRAALVWLGVGVVAAGAFEFVSDHVRGHRLQLVNAEISRRPQRDDEDPRGAKLLGVRLAGANARRAYLALANLTEASLFSMNLYKADLSEAILVDAVLSESNLDGASANGANAGGAKFLRAFLGSSQWRSAQLECADFRGAKMKGADFTGATLTAANLSGALIERASFDHADLRHANLSGAFTADATFTGAVYDDRTRFPGETVPPTAVHAPTVTLKIPCELAAR